MQPSAPSRDAAVSSPDMNRRMTWLGAAAIALATLAVYANSLSGPLVFDDVASILQNPSIRNLGRITDVLTPPATDGMTVGGRPLLNLSLALNYAISGTEVWSYHALNIVIHLLAGLTLFGIVRRTLALHPGLAAPRGNRPGVASTEGHWIALAVAALWALHPLHTEAVTYVIQRAESLMGLLYLQTLYAFIRTVEKPASRLWPAWCVGACLLGMATKEVMVSAPLIVLLYDRTFVTSSFREAWHRRRRLYAALACTWILLVVLVASHGGNRGGSIGFGVSIGWWEHALTQFRAMSRYLWLSFWPHPLAFDYGPERITGVMDVLPYVFPVGLLAWITLLGFQRRTAVGFAGVWFFAILAPTSLIPGPTQMTVEHRMYLPLAVVLTGAVVIACRLGGRRILLASLPVCAVFAGLTVARNTDYRSELALWKDTADKRPNNPVAWGSYGSALDKAGRLEEALAAEQKAQQITPYFWGIQFNLGNVLVEMGRLPEAVEAYNQALQLRPDQSEVRANLARTLALLGQFEAAAGHYRTILGTQPNSATAHAGLGLALLGLGHAADAVVPLTTASGLEPGNADIEYNLGNALMLSNRPAEAVLHYERVLALRPAFIEAACNLADALLAVGRPADAIARYEAALRLQPDHAVAHGRFGILLAGLQQLPAAIAHLGRAVELQRGGGGFLLPFATVLLQADRAGDAIPQLNAFLRLNPQGTEAAQAHTLLGTAYRRGGDATRAATEFQAALRSDPNYAPARDALRAP